MQPLEIPPDRDHNGEGLTFQNRRDFGGGGTAGRARRDTDGP
jgi:hypothetical protein